MNLFSSLIVVSVVLCEVIMIFLLKRSVEKRLDEAKQAVITFMTPKAEGDTSPLVDLLIETSKVGAHHVGNSVMAAIRGSLGGTAKAEIGEAVEGSPALGLLASVSPKAARKIARNPFAEAALQKVFNNLAGGGNGNHSTESIAQAKFKL